MRMVLLLAGFLLAACRSTVSVGPYTPPTEAERDTAKAERLSREAADLMDVDLARAEALLREALTADLYHGPAHNNLGVVFLKQEKLYEAANELEWARKLLPGHPDPKINLALVLESAGRVDEALASYSAALEVYPGYVPALQGLALTTLRTDRDDPRLGEWLDAIAVQGETSRWREWAQAERARRR